MFMRSAWLKVILGPVLDLVYGSVPLFLLAKAYGYITGFDVLTDFDRAMPSVPVIQKISGCAVRRMLLGALSWTCELSVGRHHYALAYRGLCFLPG